MKLLQREKEQEIRRKEGEMEAWRIFPRGMKYLEKPGQLHSKYQVKKNK